GCAPPTSSARKARGADPYPMVRGDECGQVFWLPDHCPSPAFPSPRLDGTGCSVASTGNELPGYSGATAPELHRTSLDPHSRRTLQRPRRGSLLEPYCEADGQRADRIHVARGDHLHEDLPPGPLDLRDGSAVHVDV